MYQRENTVKILPCEKKKYGEEKRKMLAVLPPFGQESESSREGWIK